MVYLSQFVLNIKSGAEESKEENKMVQYTLPTTAYGVITEQTERSFKILYGNNGFVFVYHKHEVVVIPVNYTTIERSVVKEIQERSAFKNANKTQNIVNHIDIVFSDFDLNEDVQRDGENYLSDQFFHNKSTVIFILEVANNVDPMRFDPYPTCCLSFPKYMGDSKPLHQSDNYSFMGNYVNPIFCNGKKHVIEKFREEYSTDVKLRKMIEKFEKKSKDKVIAVEHDSKIKESLGEDFYNLIIFYLKSNQLEIKAVDLGQPSMDSLMKSNVSTRDNVESFIKSFESLGKLEVMHPPDVESSFADKVKISGNVFLFHGSGFGNWYSLCRNGVKNMSHTKYMSTGAAYGNGIYLSDNLGTSHGYANPKYNCKTSKKIVAVFEVLGDASEYKKISNIFVCPHDDRLIMRYLLVFPNSSSQYGYNNLLIQHLDAKFGKHIKKDNLAKDKIKSSLKTTRLTNEYKKLCREIEKGKLKFEIEVPDESQFNIWHIHLYNVEANPELMKEMKERGVKRITFEFTFEQYPIKPPFVRVLHPRFMQRTAHVTIGGSICTELLTSGWRPTFSVESILTYIESIMAEGGGRLHPTEWDRPYTMAEAREAFVRIGKMYGWIK